MCGWFGVVMARAGAASLARSILKGVFKRYALVLPLSQQQQHPAGRAERALPTAHLRLRTVGYSFRHTGVGFAS